MNDILFVDVNLDLLKVISFENLTIKDITHIENKLNYIEATSWFKKALFKIEIENFLKKIKHDEDDN